MPHVINPNLIYREIHAATGWPQDKIAAEAYVDRSTIARIAANPGYKGSPGTTQKLSDLHRKVAPSPFPEFIERVVNTYTRLKETLHSGDFDLYNRSIEPLVERLVETDAALRQNNLGLCRAQWLLGTIHYDRKDYDKALEWYEQALEGIDSVIMTEPYVDLMLEHARLKMAVNMATAKFNTLDRRTRATDPDVQSWLRRIKMLESTKAIVEAYKWDWSAARNGLCCASILQDRAKAIFFWKALVSSNKAFADPMRKVNAGVPSIYDDTDMRWFVGNVLPEMSSCSDI